MNRKLRTTIKLVVSIAVIAYVSLYANLILEMKGAIGGLSVEYKELHKYHYINNEYPDIYNFKVMHGYSYRKIDKDHFEINGKLHSWLFQDRRFKVTDDGVFLWSPYYKRWQVELGPPQGAP